ncbi:ABC transporter permease/M1 family aminopeptidase [Hymenobacter guriensis]|nr:ABC transporter permease [Hymenobacter guriensis]
MGWFVSTFVRFVFLERLGMLLDPVGINFVVEDLAHLWTTTERKYRLLALEGNVLLNRLLWLGVGLITLALSYLRFGFAHRQERMWWWRPLRRRPAPAPAEVDSDVLRDEPIVIPLFARTFGLAFHARQALAIAGTSFRTMATSGAGLALLLVVPMLTVAIVVDQMEAMGTPLAPTTTRVLSELTAPLSAELSRWVIVPLLLIFFAGELIWRERDARLGELTDTLPGSDWAPLLGKFAGLGLMLVVFTALQMAAGMVAQLVLGYQDFEPGLYVKVLFGLQLPEYLLFALLALVVHVLVHQKYLGHLVTMLAYAFIAVLATMLDIEHHLLVYGAGPNWSYTPMQGFGASLGPWLWFKLYWTAWALLLAVGARLLWVRSREAGLVARMQMARRRLTHSTSWVAAAAVGLVLAIGGFIFYNTNVLNPYRSATETTARRAEYERRYRRYEHRPQPRLVATTLRVEIYPARLAVEVRGSYRLVNSSTYPIDSIHVATGTTGVDTRALRFDRQATLAVRDDAYGYRLYTLARPLPPGDTLQLDFEMRAAPQGFTNRGIISSVVANGSAFTSAAWFPMVGYQPSRELVGAADRRAYGLAPRPVVPSLDDPESGESAASGGGTAFEAVVGTDADQVAVAPGALRRTWTQGKRRYFHYVTSAPIGGEWAFFSAQYAVYKGQWHDVAIRIFHHPAHTAHLARTLRSVQASLDYNSRQFGAYPYRHLSIIEHPERPGSSLHAEAGMIWHGQGFPFWKPQDEERDLDQPYAVMAHEMGHQFQPCYAFAEGAPLLSESFAWYSALQVVRASRGTDQLRQLLAFMRQPYPFQPIRRGESLLQALDPYLAYRRGPFAFYALSEYIGTDRVNGALRRLIAQHNSAGAPPATTHDLYRELQAATPDSLQYLLHDLFEVNTYWNLKTERVVATPAGAGTWRVTLDVQARKRVYDHAGVETEVPTNDWVEVGVYAAAKEGHDRLSSPIYVRKHHLQSGPQRITVTVPRKPVLAGIDPRMLLIDLELGNNTVDVKP